MKKKAQGLSMNVIIVAVLALIVLVVLVVIFSGKVGIFGKQSTEISKEYSGETCELMGLRSCMPKAECAKSGGVEMGVRDCELPKKGGDGYVCCTN